MISTTNKDQTAYQKLMRECRNLQASPEKIHAHFQRAFQEVAMRSFDQGYEQGIQGQEAAARAAFKAGYEAGRKG